MAEGDDDGTFRDLRSLVVPAAGALVETGDPWEPYWLSDPTGVRIGPVSEYLRDLQATASRLCGEAAQDKATAETIYENAIARADGLRAAIEALNETKPVGQNDDKP